MVKKCSTNPPRLNSKSNRSNSLLRNLWIASACLSISPSWAHSTKDHADLFPPQAHWVLVDEQLLQQLKLEAAATEPNSRVSIARLNGADRARIAEAAHERGACGGHEQIQDLSPSSSTRDAVKWAKEHAFPQLAAGHRRSLEVSPQSAPSTHALPLNLGIPRAPGAADARIESLTRQVSETNIEDHIRFLSGFANRQHKNAATEQVVIQFRDRLTAQLKTHSGSVNPWSFDLIRHQSTPMPTLRLKFEGQTPGQDVVVLGGHFDSINQSWMGGQKAPGADDNASGSANLAEIARLIAQAPRLQRDVEIYWYAGEEGGLLGSAEIAKAAQSARKSVRGVLQLDMTLQPGSGRFKIGSMTDFTDANLREDLKRINTLYVGAEIIDDQCGYGCSDHASWHRHGFPAIMPTEAKKRDMNKNIHTERDVLSASSDLTHSAMFAKLGLAFALDLSGLASPSGIAQP